jgi:hypothetical protein
MRFPNLTGRRRRPPFTVVLLAILVPVVAVLLLTSRGGGGGAGSTSPTGPVRACVTARAGATAAARGVSRAAARVEQPISVTERVRTRGAIVAATRSVTAVAAARASLPVLIRESKVAAARSCGHGDSPQGAQSAALQRAYARARVRAHVAAQAAARRRVALLLHKLQPATLAAARRRATRRLEVLAARTRKALKLQDLAAAKARASGR